MSTHCPGCQGQKMITQIDGWFTSPCPGCGHEAEIAALKEFTAKLAEGRFATLDGYTILDFLKLWWEQEKEQGRKKDAEIARLTADLEDAQGFINKRANVRKTIRDAWLREKERGLAHEAEIAALKAERGDFAAMANTHAGTIADLILERDALREDLRACAEAIRSAPCNCYRQGELCVWCEALARPGVRKILEEK